MKGYARRVEKKLGGGSLCRKARERGKRFFPLLSCFTVLHRQVTDFTSLLSWPTLRGFLSSVKKQHFLSRQIQPLGLKAWPPLPLCALACRHFNVICPFFIIRRLQADIIKLEHLGYKYLLAVSSLDILPHVGEIFK